MDEAKTVMKKTAFGVRVKKSNIPNEHGVSKADQLATLIMHQAYDCLLMAWEDFWVRGSARVEPIMAEVVVSANEEEMTIGVTLSCLVKPGKMEDDEIDGSPYYDWAKERVRQSCSCCTDGVPCGERTWSFDGSRLFKDYYNIPFPIVVRAE